MLQTVVAVLSDWPIIFLISGSKDGGPTLCGFAMAGLRITNFQILTKDV